MEGERLISDYPDRNRRLALQSSHTVACYRQQGFGQYEKTLRRKLLSALLLLKNYGS